MDRYFSRYHIKKINGRERTINPYFNLMAGLAFLVVEPIAGYARVCTNG